MRKVEQLPPPASRGAKGSSMPPLGKKGKGGGSSLEPSLQSMFISISCNSQLSLWKLTLKQQLHSFASTTHHFSKQMKLSYQYVLFFPCTSKCIYAKAGLVGMFVFLPRALVLANGIILPHF